MRRRSRVPVALALVLAVAASGCSTLSLQEERQLGDSMNADARRQLPLLRDRVVNRYVSAIGLRLVEAAGPQPFSYDFQVVVAPDVNAFAMPAGHIYVQTGLILKTRNVSELAGVLAHEVGHVVKRHVAKNYNSQRNTGIAHEVGVMATALTLGTAAAGAVNLLGGLSEMAVLNRFGREAESEADAFAVEVLPRAGYDPDGLVAFFHTLEHESGPDVPAFLSSHPTTEARIEAVQEEVSELPATPGLQQTDGGRLEIIQRRIVLLTGGAPSPASASGG